MNQAIRVLHLEDNSRDAELVRHILTVQGPACDIVWVSGREDFESALQREPFDLVLSDYNVPGYDGLSALRLVREKWPAVPVIMISGTPDEEAGVECLKAGASDYVRKQRPQRLGGAVARALREAGEQQRIRRSERALRESEIRFRTLAEVSPVGIFRADAAGDWTYANDRCCEIAGIGLRRALGAGWVAALHPEDRPRVFHEWCQAMRWTHSFQSEFRFQRPDGKVAWVVGNTEVEFDAHRDVVGYVGTITDLTQIKKAELAVRQSEERWRTAMDYSAIGMALVATDGHWLKVNPAVCRMLGYAEEELLATTSDSLTHPDDRAADLENMRRMFAREIDRYQLEKRYVRKDGGILWSLLGVSLLWNPDGTPRHLVAQIQDIGERKQAEESLAQERRFLRHVIDLVPYPIVAKDRQGRFALVNRAVAELYGTAVDLMIGKTDSDYIADADEIARLRREEHAVMDKCEDKFIAEERITDAAGRVRTLKTVKRALVSAQGKADLVLAVSTEITPGEHHQTQR
jgi:PAS domain S-box-containing protein